MFAEAAMTEPVTWPVPVPIAVNTELQAIAAIQHILADRGLSKEAACRIVQYIGHWVISLPDGTAQRGAAPPARGRE